MCKCNTENEEDSFCCNEIYENGKCILHCDKRNWYKIDINGNKIWDNVKVNIFWRKIQRDLNSIYEESFNERSILNNMYFYSNVIFPSFQKDIKYCIFTDNQDTQDTNFYSYKIFEKPNTQPYPEVNSIFSRLKLKFYKCVFLDDSDFTRYNFKEDILFHECIFKSKLDFSKNIFINKFKFVDCDVEGVAHFYRTKFDKIAAFDKTKFNEVNFRNCRFNSLSRFINTEFRKKIDFRYTYFYKNCVFNEMKIKSKINLEKAIFFEKVNFYNITYNSYCIENRETARIIKDSFEQQNNIIEANKFYALEMKEREKELNWKKDFFEKLVFKFHGISSNHSQDWILTLFWILNITFGFFITEKSFELFGNTFISYIPILVLMILGITNSSLSSIIRTTFIVILTFLNYGIFRIISDDNSLDCVANKINPFSIMTKGEDLDFPTMIYKIIIAYLIYQLIISIRQNTRRK